MTAADDRIGQYAPANSPGGDRITSVTGDIPTGGGGLVGDGGDGISRDGGPRQSCKVQFTTIRSAHGVGSVRSDMIEGSRSQASEGTGE
jgi:hypothetical protein